MTPSSDSSWARGVFAAATELLLLVGAATLLVVFPVLIIYLCLLTLQPVWYASLMLFYMATGKLSPISRGVVGYIVLRLFVLVIVAALGWVLYFFTRLGWLVVPVTLFLDIGGQLVMILSAKLIMDYFDAKHAAPHVIYIVGSPRRFQYSRTFTEDEYKQLPTALSEGGLPGWYFVLRDQTLCIYRAYGWCHFQLELERGEGGWRVSEAWSDSRRRYANEEYVKHLVNYILDGLMFGRWRPHDEPIKFWSGEGKRKTLELRKEIR